MDEELSKKKMQEQTEQLLGSPLIERHGWSVETEELTLTVTMPSPKTDEEFTLVVDFDNFPQEPPSYQFDGDWPDSPDIQEDKGVCIPGTREFYTAFNHGDRKSEWDHEKYSLTVTLHKIFHLMRG